MVPYHLATPLFTDYALKYRLVYVPKGLAARYDPKEAFAFPVGSILVKTFAYAPDLRHPDDGVRPIETRLLVHSARGWRAFAYVWRADLTDAEIKLAGATVPVSFTAPDGRMRHIRYQVPNMNQCKACHVLGKAITPIGPKARNLNVAHDYGDGVVENQLVHWTRLGILEGAPADLDAALFLTWDQPVGPNLGIMKRPTAAGRGAGSLLYDIVPGRPDESILLYRMESTDPGVMMPELGRTIVHEEGVALIRAWIASLDEEGGGR